MQIKAETSATFCWDRLQFLQKHYFADGYPNPFKSVKGRWPTVRETAWKSAEKRCEAETIWWGKMIPEQSPSIEYQIHRKDHEKYLHAIKNHLSSQLFKIENTQQKIDENSKFPLPGTIEANWIKDHAPKYWKTHPIAKHDEVFNDYIMTCPDKFKRSRSRWNQLVRDNKLDPREKSAKKRGLGKKTF